MSASSQLDVGQLVGGVTARGVQDWSVGVCQLGVYVSAGCG